MSFLTFVWNRFRKTFRNWCDILFSLFVSRSNCVWWRCEIFGTKFSNFFGEIFMLRSLGYDLDTVVYTYSNTFFLLVFSESFGGFFGGGAFDVLKNVELLLVGFTISVEERIIPEHSSRVDSDYKYITTELKYDWWISKRPAIQIFPFSNVKMNLTIPAVKLFVRFYTE